MSVDFAHLPRSSDHVQVDELTRLARAAGKGDRYAAAAFVRLSEPEVRRACSALVDAQNADDLTQETYLRAFPALANFRAESSARTWLLSIARYTCADAIRRRVRDRNLNQRLVSFAQPETGSVSGGYGLVDQRDLIEQLEPERREAFVLTQVAGLSYAEAAEVCDCPIGTIRSRVSRARADLLGMLETGERSAAEA